MDDKGYMFVENVTLSFFTILELLLLDYYKPFDYAHVQFTFNQKGLIGPGLDYAPT